MLKAIVIFVAIIIMVVNVSAQSSSRTQRRVVRKAGVVRVGPSTIYLKQGLTTEEVVRLLGSPTAITDSETAANGVTYEFERGEGRVLLAEFLNGSLVSSRVEARTSAQSGR